MRIVVLRLFTFLLFYYSTVLRIFFQVYWYLASYALVERNERLSGIHARNHLHLVVEQVHKLLVVAGVNLEQHGVRACGEVAFHYLGDGEQLLHYILIHASTLEVKTDVGAGGVAHTLGVDVETTASDDATGDEVLHTLVNGCTRYATFCCHILERYAGVFRKNA
jgi:hypothetical protein